MVACVQHEAFYTSGIYTAPELGCAIGWVSHPDSYSDCNPILSASGDVALIFSGEHFGGVSGANATELLAMYQTRGDAFLRDLNGWFSGVLIDHRERRVAVFNDRYGMGRLYWIQRDDAFVFASEAKALLSLYSDHRAFDVQSVAEFLTLGSVSLNSTLFSGVSLIPGAALWTFHNSPSPRRQKYFDIQEWEAQPSATGEQYYQSLKDSIRSIVPNYCSGSSPVGVSLTGGLDTRMIMAARRPTVSTPCYTYGGTYRNCFDVQTAAQVAALCGQDYQVIPLQQDFFANFERLAERTIWLSDGALDICGTHELYFSERARQISTYRLTGNYGSEVLRSITTYKASSPSNRFLTADFSAEVTRARDAHLELGRSHPVTYAVTQEIPWHLYGRLVVAQSQLQVRSPFMDNDLVSLAYRAPAGQRTGNSLLLRLISELDSRLGNLDTDMGLHAGRAQTRFRPRRLIRYLLFKAEWYYNYGMPQSVARFDSTLLRPFERLFLGTHKIDYYRVWFRDQLNAYIQAVLSQPGIADVPFVLRQPAGSPVRWISGQDALDIGRIVSLYLVRKQFFAASSTAAHSTAEIPSWTSDGVTAVPDHV